MRLVTLALSILLSTFSGCSKPEIVESKPRPVVSMTVGDPVDQSQRSFSGQVIAGDSANLAFEVSGRIETMNAQLGKPAKRGDILASIDKSDYETRLSDASASLEQASQELLRAQQLFETGNASQSQLESAIRTETSARASFDLAQRQLRNTDLIMPFDGVISSVELESQELASAGQTVVRIQKKGIFEFHFGVPTDLVNSIQSGFALEVSVNDAGPTPLKATVLRVSPSSNSDTTYTVESRLENSPETIREGMVGEALVDLTNAQAEAYFELPLASVFGGGTQSKPAVWTLNPGADGTATIEKKYVETGFLLRDGLIAITSGVEPGDIVVTRGVNEIKEGMIVRYLQ
ncbi:MAG: efflux RND transporter periplasmic adaptor subunit [Opitutales bacterium]